jgi:hypothetical protein
MVLEVVPRPERSVHRVFQDSTPCRFDQTAQLPALSTQHPENALLSDTVSGYGRCNDTMTASTAVIMMYLQDECFS